MVLKKSIFGQKVGFWPILALFEKFHKNRFFAIFGQFWPFFGQDFFGELHFEVAIYFSGDNIFEICLKLSILLNLVEAEKHT